MQKRIKSIFLILLLIVSGVSLGHEAHFPAGTCDVTIPNVKGIRRELLKNIAPIVEKSISQGAYPGAVILVAHHGHLIYQGVFGNRRIIPDVAPMRLNTIFDIASLTKVVATAPAIMQLIEQSKLNLDAPVSEYWPAFGIHGKESITIRELLTHTSGLPADIPVSENATQNNKKNILEQIIQLKLKHPPGTTYIYSDINFVVLQHLLEIKTGESLDEYTQNHIFNPLKMKDTHFDPSNDLKDRIAPTQIIHDELRWGKVQDPLAHAMGGISGNAGLFSDAKDLGAYAQCLLNNGQLPPSKTSSNSKDGKKPSGYLLGPLTILKMITPQTPPSIEEKRGLGWDIDSPYTDRGVFFPTNSFGHSGWTGTSIWIDPVTKTWIIILTSRTHPSPAPHNELIQDRRMIANIISASITDLTIANKTNTSVNELYRAY